MIDRVKTTTANIWARLQDADFRTVTMWVAVVAMVMAFIGLYRAQGAAADARNANIRTEITLAEIEHDNEVQTWTYRRDQAKVCVEEWARYEDLGHLYVDNAEGIGALWTALASTPPTPEQLEVIRQVYSTLFSQYPPPDCARDEAAEEAERARDRLDELNALPED